MARKSAATTHENSLWPFLDGKGAPVVHAAKVVTGRDGLALSGWRAGDDEEEERIGRGGIRNGWRNGWRTPLRPVSSAVSMLDVPSGRPMVTLGWHPDLPDLRDQDIADSGRDQRVARARAQMGQGSLVPPKFENLRWCSPVENQGALGSCTAQAVVGLMEFMQRRAGIQHVDGSRLFLYKVTRKLLGWSGDTGAYLRTAMKAVAAFGIPPEEHWPYDISRYEEEPSAFLYSFGQSYRALDYTRIDPPGRAAVDVIERARQAMVAGLGVVLGFSVYSSLTASPDILLPSRQDRLQGGHAVLAVGYDDNHTLSDGTASPSFIIRNSWGTSWGVGGYGFLPYEYVERGLARDFWTVLKAEWLEQVQFDDA